jgi:hypothetical protein
MAATPLWVWMCHKGSYQFSQRKQGRGIDLTTRQRSTWRSRLIRVLQRLSPGCENEHPRTIRKLNAELGFTYLTVIRPENLNHLAVEWMMRMGNPHTLLLTSYGRSSLLIL